MISVLCRNRFCITRSSTAEGLRVADVSQERAARAHRINRLVFAEYSAVGWFKVAPLDELRRYAGRDDGAVVAGYALAPDDPAADREVIRVFLRDWLCCHHPESIGAWGLEVAAFRPVSRPEALAVADRIVAGSLEDPEATIGGCLEWEEPATPEEAADVPYPQLRAWFAELFGEGCRFSLHHAAGGPTVRFDRANPRVIGLAPDLVGMLWLE
jgi:hypothetical protein